MHPMVEAKADKKPKKELRHVMIEPAENGGAVVRKVWNHYGYPDEVFAFGKGQEEKALAYIAKCLGMKSGNPGDAEEY